jgi:hypothetical protein
MKHGPHFRERLPNRRPHELINLEHARFRFIAGVGHFPDGRLAEIFLNGSKTGTAIDVAARDSAIVASLALQHGVSPDELRRALSHNPDGTAGGPLAAVLDHLAADDDGRAP